MMGPVTRARIAMAEVEIYTTPLCPYCWRAKRLLGQKGITFAEIDLWQQPARRAEMVERTGGRSTVPQIFVDGRPLGEDTGALAGFAPVLAFDARGRQTIGPARLPRGIRVA